MKSPPATSLRIIRETLVYDPDTGDLTWTTPPRTGELAGYYHARDKRLVVGINYRKHAATHVAWFLHKGEWPLGRIALADGDPENLAFRNLVFTPLSDDPKAAYARTRRQRQKQELAEKQRLLEGFSTIPGVRFSVADRGGETDLEREQRKQAGLPPLEGRWLACDPHDKHRVRGSFETQDEAEKFQRLFQHALDYMAANPPPHLPDRIGRQPAGSASGLTLADAHAFFCYDPGYGVFYHRITQRTWMEGHRADHLNASRRPVVTFASRQYPAAMLAWFMTNYEWPPRKSIFYRDKDPRNITLGNMFIPDYIDRTHRVEPMQEATE